MTIISTDMLANRLPGVSSASDLTAAVNRATSFVNTYAVDYDPFDDYQLSPEAILAPAEIGEICLAAAESFYFLEIGQQNRDGNEQQLHREILYGGGEAPGLKETLKEIKIEPEWVTETIVLNSDLTMGLGSRTVTGGKWPRVIPDTAQVISATSNIWVYRDDFSVRRGGSYNDEYHDRWYLHASSSAVEGTIRYMRTYRNDALDYRRYMTNG